VCAQAEQLAAARGIQLPKDLFAAASAGGLYRSVLERYAQLQARPAHACSCARLASALAGHGHTCVAQPSAATLDTACRNAGLEACVPVCVNWGVGGERRAVHKQHPARLVAVLALHWVHVAQQAGTPPSPRDQCNG